MKRVLAATFLGLLISSVAFAQKSDEQMIIDRAQEFADALKNTPGVEVRLRKLEGEP